MDRGIQEAGDVRDAPLAKVQHVHRADPVVLGAALADVADEAGLRVGPDREQPPLVREDALCEEPSHVLAAEEPGGERRHREPDVLGEHLEQGRHVRPLPGAHEGVHERALAVRPERRQLGLLAGLRHPLADRPASALERAVHRGRRRPQDARGLGG
jgi:hypothetical protein